MAKGAATLHSIVPPTLNEALRTTLALAPASPGQEIAQREIAKWLEDALEARRQRILVSHAQVNPTKWACLILQAVCALLAIAVVHSDNRLASAIALGTFATGVAASVLLILAHDRPFTGAIAVSAEPLLQVMPEAESRRGRKQVKRVMLGALRQGLCRPCSSLIRLGVADGHPRCLSLAAAAARRQSPTAEVERRETVKPGDVVTLWRAGSPDDPE